MHHQTMWTLSISDAARVCRDLAWSELAASPTMRSRLNVAKIDRLAEVIDWSEDGLCADSLTRTSLATAAATWCDSFQSGYSDLFLARKNTLQWAEVMLRVRSADIKNRELSLTFSTSGSTGQRKHIRHPEEMLWLEACGWAEKFKDCKRVIVCTPVNHIYGFIWGVMLPQALGVPVVELAWDSENFPQKLNSDDLVVAVPAQWQWWAHAGQIKRWPKNVIGVSSTAPMQVETAYSAHQQGLSKLLAIYGSTETAGIGWRDDIAYAIDPTQHLYTTAPTRMKCPNSSGVQVNMPNGRAVPLNLQDEIQWHGEHHFALFSRLDHVVQVGGHNVSPSAVEKKLIEHPDVAAVSVRLDSTLQPPRLKAFFVLRDNASSHALEQWIGQLPPHEQPARITYGLQLVRNAMGKLEDWN